MLLCQEKIQPIDTKAMERAKAHWDTIAKPLNSLGKLETAIIKIAGMQKTKTVDISKPVVCAFCADNGVVAQGVTQVESHVTAIVSGNMARGESSVCIMGRRIGAPVIAVDVGINVDMDVPTLVNKKIMYGTNDFTLMPAMTREQAEKAVEVGIQMAFELKEKGYNIIATGEMGIGNTTTSAAVAAVLLGCEASAVTGRGSGLSNQGLERKINAINKAIALHNPNPNDPIDILAKVGGLDIGAIAGLFIGGAMVGIPVVIDGFISAVSALLATKINPGCYDYMLPSHCSAEPAGKLILEQLNFTPLLTCEMCLGEGTGAVMGIMVMQTAMDIYNTMSSFENINIDNYQHFSS